MTKNWILIKITTKCPDCGREYTDEGKGIEHILDSQITCSKCGFIGEINAP